MSKLTKVLTSELIFPKRYGSMAKCSQKSEPLLINGLDSVKRNTPVLILDKHKINIIPIEDLKPNPTKLYSKPINSDIRILTNKGWTKIKYIYSHKTKKLMYRILTREGFIECSSDHSLIISNKKVKPSELKIGDKLDLINYPKRTIIYNLNNDFCWLLGFFVAEGHCGIHKGKKGIEFSLQFNNTNLEFLKKAKKILDSLFIESKIYVYDYKYETSIIGKLCVTTLKKQYVNIFREMCYTSDGKKKIPYQIFNSTDENVIHFLTGLYDGDGHFYAKKGCYGYGTNSHTLAHGICYLHKILNKSYSLYIRKDKPDIIEINTWKHNEDYYKKIINPANVIRKIEKYKLNDYIYDIETTNHCFTGGCGNVLLHNTETDHGKPFVCGYYCDNNFKGFTLLKNLQDVLGLLTSQRFRKSVNLFYNLTFDVEGILKYLPNTELVKIYFKHNILIHKLDYGNFEFLDLSEVEQLKKTTFNDRNYYRLTYIPGKFFRIKHGHDTLNYYDLLQYYNMSLKKAAEKYLDIEKLEFDTENVSLERFKKDKEYHDKLLKYVVRDSELCQKLGSLLFKNLYEVYKTKNFMSTASISEDYIRKTVNPFLPRLGHNVITAFLSAYHGGRFEILKRGKIDNAKEYDISSAYAYEMANMPMITNTYWLLKVFKENDDCLYGSYNIDIKIPQKLYVSPIPYFDVKDNLLKFPTGIFKNFWIDKVELDFLKEYDFDFKINYGYEIYDDNAKCFLKDIMQNSYNKKEYYKKLGDEIKANTYKTICNASYGKFIQTCQEMSFEPVKSIEEVNDHPKNEIFMINDVMYIGYGGNRFRVGGLFAPWYASYITAKIRIKLLKTLSDLNDTSIHAFHTDSIITDKKINIGNEMGDWTMKETGELLLYKSGYYKLGDKTRCRGYSHFNPTKSKQKRRIGLGYAIRNSKMDELNYIVDKEIDFNLIDKKRNWFRISKVLEDSTPIDIKSANQKK